MSITKMNPRTIHLGGPLTEVNDLPLTGTPLPGFLMERYSNSGVDTYRAHSTAGGPALPSVLPNQPYLKKAYDVAFADGDLAHVGVGVPGTTFYMIIGSGVNTPQGGFLESAGNGRLRNLASGTRLFQALEAVNNSAGPGDAYLRVETVG